MCLPSIVLTRTLPSRSRATATVSRSKNSGPSSRPAGAVSVRSGSRLADRLGTARVTASLVDVQRLVSDLVHGLPVHARPPGCDADAELDRHRRFACPVQLLERLANAC